MKVAEDTVSLTGAGGGGMGKWQQQLRVDSCGTNAEWERERECERAANLSIGISAQPQPPFLSLSLVSLVSVPGSGCNLPTISSAYPLRLALPSRAADELNFSNEPTRPVKLMWIDVDVRDGSQMGQVAKRRRRSWWWRRRSVVHNRGSITALQTHVFRCSSIKRNVFAPSYALPVPLSPQLSNAIDWFSV